MHKKEYKKCIILFTFAEILYIFCVLTSEWRRYIYIYIYLPATDGGGRVERERET